MKKEEEYKEIFLAESLENYEEINRILTLLEKSPEDSSHINSLFRITHTLKGNATGMGFVEIGELAHVLEDLFGEVREKRMALTADTFSAVFKAVDVLGRMIESLQTGDKVESHRGIKTKLQVLIKNQTSTGTTPPEEKESTQQTTKKTVPAKKGKPAAKKDIRKKSAQEDASKPAKNKAGVGEEPVQAAPEISEKNEEKTNEIAPTENRMTFSDLVQVPVRKLDNLLNLVGELIIERDRIIASQSESGNSNGYVRLNRITSDLQYSVMDVRLVQVGFLFNKFHRVVRDAAAIEGKKVRLELEGVDTEIDRNILQIISDSLIHLIRNSVSHGIESPGDRLKSKKKEEGCITLSARNENDGVIIEIKDDGKGINIQKVKEKILEKGLMNTDMLELLSQGELLMMLFEAGFSTREEVSELSGRGVGMDVVKKAIDSIGGSIKIDTETGRGTSVILSLPSSMTVKGTLLFGIELQTYAIPLSYTEAVVSLYKSDLNKLNKGLVTTYAGKTISVIFLKELLNRGASEIIRSVSDLSKGFDDLHPEAAMDMVIVTYNGRTIGLVVDKLLQQKEIVEKPLGRPLDRIQLISGVTILGNGEVCPVLNIAAITNYIFNISLLNYTL